MQLKVSNITYEPGFPVRVTVESEDALKMSTLMTMWLDVVALYNEDTVENGMTRFYFRSKADATLFVLKWSGFNG